MLAPTTACDFVRLLRQSGLIDEPTLASMEGSLPSEPAACADSLVQSELLTLFQAKQLLAGRVRGLVMGAYRILRPLGEGGMGVVYLAEQTNLGRKVAIKVLNEEQSKEELALERFFREARAAAALDHPNIVRLHDIAQFNGTYFLVMEFVEGMDLQGLIDRNGSLDCNQAAKYIVQAAAGLQHAHERGFIHRDIKPANLIVAKSGSVKVLDMGLARSVRNPKDMLTGLLKEDVITGTADYLSPEQALNVQLDARTDIYSLGVTFFTLLIGRPPFEGSTTQKLAQHQMAAAPDLCKLRSDVSPALNAVVMRMMAKQARERYQTASEVIAALAPWASLPPESGSTISLRLEPTTTIIPQSPETKQSGSYVGRLFRSPRKWIGAGLTTLLIAAGVLFAAFGKPKPAATQSANGDLRSLLPSDFQLLTDATSPVNDVVLSPDQTLLASADWSGKLLIWDIKTGQLLRELPTRPGACGLACATSPDGRLVLIAGQGMPIFAFEWATGRKVREYPAHEGSTWGLAVSPSGEHLLSCGGDGFVVLRELSTGKEVRRFEFEAKVVWAAAFSPDGTKIAAGSGEGTVPDEAHLIKVWSTADGKELHRLTGHTAAIRTLGFRPDGQVLASGSFDGKIKLWDLNTGKEFRTMAAHDGVVERVAFLPGGERLLTCGGPQSNDRANGEGGTVKLWDVNTGREIQIWRWAGLISLVPSRDGQFAVAGDRDQNVRIWPLPASLVVPVDKQIHAFDFSALASYRLTHQDGQYSDPYWPGSPVPGVYLHCWKDESYTEFRGGVADSQPWIGVTNLNSAVSSQILFQFDRGLNLPLIIGKQYRVRLEYRTLNDAEGFAYIRNPKDDDYFSVCDRRLDSTGGKWKVVELFFRKPSEGKIDVCIVNSQTGEGKTLAVRSLEVFEIDSDP